MNDSLNITRYETWELDAIVAQIERPNPWLLRTFFGREKLFTSKTIEFDVIDRGRRMAPFVSPLAAGKPMRREGYHTRQLSPAYIKPTDLVLPQEGFTRRPGEAYGGDQTPQQRFDALVAETLDNHGQMIENRMEWMAASALVNGYIRIEGDDYPPVLVSFGRDTQLEGALLSGARWSQVTSTPMADIETFALKVRQLSKGAIVTDLIMDGQAWTLLRKHAEVKDLIDTNFRRSLPGQTPTSIDAGPRTVLNEAQFVGTLNGTLNLWVYDSYYEDDTGTEQPYLPAYTVLGIATKALEGTQYFGAILDLDAQIGARRTFSKSEVKFNPSGLEIVTQSAPLVAPRRPNAMFKLTVN